MSVIGKTVYTVNNITNEVDTWTVVGTIPTKLDIKYVLEGSKGMTILPNRCVFDTYENAIEVANK